MNQKLLYKYISGNASDGEKELVTKWIQESSDNMREYMALRKLYDITLWRTEPGKEKMQEKKRFSLHNFGREMLKIAAVFAVVIFGTYFWMEKQQQERQSLYQSIYVPAGQRAEITLSDGTKVWMNSQTTLTFPNNFSDGTRNVKLNGEAYFAVTKNAGKPFIVEMNKYNVKVLGTEFNAFDYATDSIFEVSLLKGAVEIYKQGRENDGLQLEANTMATLQANQLIKGQIKYPDHFRWREGLMCFDNISIKDIIEKLKLYYDADIIVKNNKILDRHYSGKFRIDDGLEHVLRVLQLNNKFTYIKDDETNVLTIK